MLFNKKQDQIDKAWEVDLPGRPSGWQWRFGAWLTTHRLQARRWAVILLIVAGVSIWPYTIYRLIMYYTVEEQQWRVVEEYLTKNLINYQDIQSWRRVSQIAVLESGVLSGSQQKADLFARVTNPNTDWAVAGFKYRFVLNSGATPWRQSFLLPGEEKYLLELAVAGGGQNSLPNLEVSEVNWQRVNKHQIPDYAVYYQEYFNFKIEDIKFNSSSESLATNKVPVSEASFKVANNTAYNFWRVGFQVILYSGRSVAGINYITLEQWQAGEQRPVSVYWYERLPGISRVEIIPEVDILNSDAYMKLEGGIGEPK